MRIIWKLSKTWKLVTLALDPAHRLWKFREDCDIEGRGIPPMLVGCIETEVKEFKKDLSI